MTAASVNGIGQIGLALIPRMLLMQAVVCLTVMESSPVVAADQPNIVLVMADDQGYGDVGYNGHPVLQTPVLDEIASTGLRLDRFYAAHPVCSPTRGSVLTGRHPNRFACFCWGHTLRPEEITVAEAMRTAGYATGHFGKWHVGTVRGDDEVSPGGSGFDVWVSSPNFYENNPLFSANGQVIEAQGESSEVTVREALKFIEQQAKNQRPSLTVIWFGNPHLPHEAQADLRALYPDEPPGRKNYFGEITGIDRSMGLLRSELRRMGIADNTIVWYTSDNGPTGPGSSGGLRGKKGSLWEGGVRVPGIIEWPARIKTAARSSVPANTVDIYPTLLELAGVSMPNQPSLDGISLLPLIDGTLKSRPRPICFWVHPTPGIRTPSAVALQELREEQAGTRPATAAPQRTAASRMEQSFPGKEFPGHSVCLVGDWKLHRIPQEDKGTFRYELYDLSSDPKESRNLAEAQPERVASMRLELEAWLESVVRSLNGEDYVLPKRTGE